MEQLLSVLTDIIPWNGKTYIRIRLARGIEDYYDMMTSKEQVILFLGSSK